MFCGNGNSCLWIILILIVLFSCCGGNNWGNSCDNGCSCTNNGCC